MNGASLVDCHVLAQDAGMFAAGADPDVGITAVRGSFRPVKPRDVQLRVAAPSRKPVSALTTCEGQVMICFDLAGGP